MSLLSPIYLVALLPWIILAILLLIGQLKEQPVPFLQFWRGRDIFPRDVQPTLRIPPVALICALGAILLAILAAAKPRLPWGIARTGPRISIVLDRGLTMQAGDHGTPRWKLLLRTANPTLLAQFGAGPVDLYLLPEGKVIHADRRDWVVTPNQTDPPPIDSREMLNQIIPRIASQGDEPIIVLSDQPAPLDNPRVIQLGLQSKANNIGIISASLRDQPRPQGMVRIRNDSDLSIATLSFSGQTKVITLPKPGETNNYFIDLDQISPRMKVEVVVEDDLQLDNYAELIRTNPWPVVEIRGDTSPQIQRMIQAYSSLRLPSESSSRVIVSTDATAGPSVILAPTVQAVSGPVQVQRHPVSSDIDWQAVGRQSIRIANPPLGEWKSIVSINDRPIVLVREGSARQVWIGFDSDAFAQSSDFVIFWSNILDWASRAETGYQFAGISAIPMSPPMKNDWRRKLDALPVSSRAGTEIAPGLLLSAMLLIGLSALTWMKVS